MPPFLGGPREADEIAAYIEGCLDRRSVAAIYGFQGVELGQKLFQIRCAKCHPMGGRGDKSKSLAGLTREDYQNLLNAASDLGVGMPAFTADDADRRALIEYLMTIKAGGTK